MCDDEGLKRTARTGLGGRSLAVRAGIALCGLLIAHSTMAGGTVEGLRAPAWLERNGERIALTPGMAVPAGSAVQTGKRGRALLRLEEGSHVKLGENALFSVDSFEAPKERDGVFSGVFQVLRGAFRFSTTLLSRRTRRRIDIKVSAVTAGIRGTDIWGRAAPDRDIVCLIEGAVEVRRGDETPISMTEPLSFYIAPKGQPALPVQPVEPEQLRRWAEQTEIASGAGGISSTGQWSAHLKSFASRDQAQAAVAELVAAGYPASLALVEVRGKRWFRVSIAGVGSVEGARLLGEELEGQFGIRNTWFSRTR